MKRLLSGIKPTGDIHIGNYFGAMLPWLQMQNEYESYIFIADLHALNQIHNKEELARNILEIAKAYLAIGLDPQKVTLFRQSQVSAHAELCWILNSIASMGMLERAHAYKDALAKGKTVSVGTFDYPVLMAADILLYSPEVVPVGYDQRQHVEIAQDLAERFNHLFGPTLAIPQVLLQEEGDKILGLDGQKMSKSYQNVLGLFDTSEVVTKKVMSIKTDSTPPEAAKNPETDTVFAFHKLFSQPDLPVLRQRYIGGEIGYKESKEILLNNINKFLKPIQERKAELDAKPGYVLDILEDGRKRADAVAQAMLSQVKERVGL